MNHLPNLLQQLQLCMDHLPIQHIHMIRVLKQILQELIDFTHVPTPCCGSEQPANLLLFLLHSLQPTLANHALHCLSYSLLLIDLKLLLYPQLHSLHFLRTDLNHIEQHQTRLSFEFSHDIQLQQANTGVTDTDLHIWTY